MSSGTWDDIKKPFYKVAEGSSDRIEDLAQKWNLPWLEEEAAKNKKNPGRAIGKAAGYALGGWLGGLYGGAAEAAGAAGAAGAGATGAGVGAGASGAASLYGGAQNAGLLADLYGAAIPGLTAGSEQAAMLAAQTGEFGAPGLGSTMQAASGAEGLSPLESMAGKYGGNFMRNIGGNKFAKRFALNQAQGLLSPPQEKPMPQRMPQGQQQPFEPVQMPYGGSGGPYGGLLETEEERRRRLREMGYY